MKRLKINDRGSFVRWLCASYGQKPITLITRELAEAQICLLDKKTPPVKAVNFFVHRRVIDFALLPRMKVDGRLLVRRNGFRIEVKATSSNRIRFTVAHELGHTFFYDLGKSPPRRSLPGLVSQDEEIFCNRFASELLMPREMVLNQIRLLATPETQRSPAAIISRLAAVFEVSCETMARRMIEELMVFNGISLGCRWLPGVATGDDEPSEPSWRLAWWSASPCVIGPLFLPLPVYRPRVKVDILEQAYAERKDVSLELETSSVRLGNLRKILNEGATGGNWVDASAIAVLPEGVQILGRNNETQANSAAEEMRERSEVVLFFHLERVLEYENCQNPRRM